MTYDEYQEVEWNIRKLEAEVASLKKCADERLDWARVAENKVADLKDELAEWKAAHGDVQAKLAESAWRGLGLQAEVDRLEERIEELEKDAVVAKRYVDGGDVHYWYNRTMVLKEEADERDAYDLTLRAAEKSRKDGAQYWYERTMSLVDEVSALEDEVSALEDVAKRHVDGGDVHYWHARAKAHEETIGNLNENYDKLFTSSKRNVADLRDAREKFQDAWDRLGKANDMIDAMNEWIGKFGVKYTMPLQALTRDLQKIKDGWTQAGGVSPWEESK
jgi:predicted  nucleic acid-binding Zn-ribbon protein